MSIFYLDNNATTRVLPPVLDAMLPWFQEHYGNASSSHQLGQHAKAALAAARSAVAAFLGVSPGEVIFTSGATEANHAAILGALALNPARKRIVTSVVEHPSTLRLLDHLASQGVEIIRVPVLPSGALDLAALAEAINAHTALVTLMHANNETGVLLPIAEAATLAHQHGALFHSDAAQTAGKLMLNARDLDCDLLSFSGHKLHAPKGIGVLFVRKGLPLPPMIHGHQERNRRGGTENLPTIVGLDVACRLAQEYLAHHPGELAALRDRLQSGILARLPFASVNGAAARVPNTCSLTFPGLNGEELLHRLDQAGVVASQGSACTAGGNAPSHALLAMGLGRDNALSSVRFSLSRETTAAEIDQVTTILASVAHAMSSLRQAA